MPAFAVATSVDADVLRRFADVGCSRLIVSVQESGSTDLRVIRDFLRSVLDVVATL